MTVLDEIRPAERPGLPEADRRIAPGTLEEAARALDHASGVGARVLVWGGGTHQGFGYRIDPDIVLSTERLDEVVAYDPADMTAVVQAGVGVAELETRLAEHEQTALLTERPGGATIGGAVAAGVSGWRRARFGPTRDRVLEVTLVTGDGRLVTGGGRVVKNVTGYDLPRMATGSFGSLGLIGQVCLKLWPRAAAVGTVMVEDAETALARAYRPLAVLETRDGAWCYLAGTRQEVEGQAVAIGGFLIDSLEWPDPIEAPIVVSMRVPPSVLRGFIERLDPGWEFVAQMGVGEVTVGLQDAPLEALTELRAAAERMGGSLVTVTAPQEVYERFDPWGTPPSTLDIQRRVIARFDPVRVVNPGRMPGRL